MKKLPKTIAVRLEEDGDESYLVAEATPFEHADVEQRQVGIYELVKTENVVMLPTIVK